MGYGLRVLNADNKVILNTDDGGLSTLVKAASGGVTGGNFGYPSGTSSSDLFLVHLPGDGFIAQNMTTVAGSESIYSSYTSAITWIKGAATTTGIVSGYNTGYGLKITDSAGNLTFSSETSDALEIVAVGTYGSLDNSPSLSYTINSTTEHYVLIPGSAYFSYAAGFPVNSSGTFKQGYEFHYSGSTCTSIEIHRSFVNSSGAVVIGSSSGAATYMIVKYRS